MVCPGTHSLQLCIYDRTRPKEISTHRSSFSLAKRSWKTWMTSAHQRTTAEFTTPSFSTAELNLRSLALNAYLDLSIGVVLLPSVFFSLHRFRFRSDSTS